MAQETLQLIPSGDLIRTHQSYVIDFGATQRRHAGIRYRTGKHALHGPVALKIAENPQLTAGALRRERDVSVFLGSRGGELISKCVAYELSDSSAMILVGYRGRSLAEMARDQEHWPPADGERRKMVIDLLQTLELLRLSGIVHGGISLYTLYWDGTTLQLVDFASAALQGHFPDGRPAHYGIDVEAAGRVIYEITTGSPPPADPAALRHQIEEVTDADVTGLLLHRDLVTRRDVDYVFAADPDARPTARIMLDRLDRRPHGVQWRQLQAREAEVRSGFRDLRRQQREFRLVYQHWLNPPPPATGRVPWRGQVPRPRGEDVTADLRGNPAWPGNDQRRGPDHAGAYGEPGHDGGYAWLPSAHGNGSPAYPSSSEVTDDGPEQFPGPAAPKPVPLLPRPVLIAGALLLVLAVIVTVALIGLLR